MDPDMDHNHHNDDMHTKPQVHLHTGQAASAFHYFSSSINLKPDFAHRCAVDLNRVAPACGSLHPCKVAQSCCCLCLTVACCARNHLC